MKTKILKKLKSEEFISGQSIADDLNISRTAVFKHIKSLQKDGFVIESVSRKGYRIVAQTEKLHPLIINNCLKTKFIARELLHFDQVKSTINQVIVRADKAGEGLTVIAEKQTTGRGRFQRAWASPKGGIWCSILLRPKSSPAEAARLNIIASLAIVSAIKEVVLLDAHVKWPNDVLTNDLKVAGILTDMSAELDRINYAVLSFGLNVNNRTQSNLTSIATSLKEVTGNKINRVGLFCSIMKNIETYYTDWQKGYFDNVLKEFKSKCITLGKIVKVSGLNKDFKGEAVDIDEEGRLILKTGDSVKQTLSSGEVTVIRK